MWIKFGESPTPPKPDPATRLYIEANFGLDVGRVIEAVMVDRHGWLVFAEEELAFVQRSGKGFATASLPYRSITETKISKSLLFDHVIVSSNGRRLLIRIFRDRRDVGQEFFNRLQLSLGAVRFPAA